MKALLIASALILSLNLARADEPDCSKWDHQLSFNSVESVKDVLSGKVTSTTRIGKRCYVVGEVAEVVLSSDPADANGKRKPQGRVKFTVVNSNVKWDALTDANATKQELKNKADLQAFLTGIYGKNKDNTPRDLSKEL